MRFQSTHPVWDATTGSASTRRPSRFQSTHPVWDATTVCPVRTGTSAFQSTHPVWDATRFDRQCGSIFQFQSTHPVWDATVLAHVLRRGGAISIHASRMGCDVTSAAASVYQDLIFDTMPVCAFSPETALFLGFSTFQGIERERTSGPVFICYCGCCCQKRHPQSVIVKMYGYR